jgi:hypothetical protein
MAEENVDDEKRKDDNVEYNNDESEFGRLLDRAGSGSKRRNADRDEKEVFF